jgi:ribosomal protein S18 acetylase RimI-like enzyme
MTTDVQVLPATAADESAIAALHAASWRATYRGVLPDAFLDHALLEDRQRHWHERMHRPLPTQIVLKAVAGDALVGFACSYLDTDKVWGALIDNLHVAPHVTGGGIGWHLLDATMASVRNARPHSRLHLWVFAANRRARRFYERHGGIAIEEQLVEVLPGVNVPEVRYGWTL